MFPAQLVPYQPQAAMNAWHEAPVPALAYALNARGDMAVHQRTLLTPTGIADVKSARPVAPMPNLRIDQTAALVRELWPTAGALSS